MMNLRHFCRPVLRFKPRVINQSVNTCEICLKREFPPFFNLAASYSDKRESESSPKEKGTTDNNSNNTSGGYLQEDDFEKKFWARAKAIRGDQQDMFDPYPDRIRYRKTYDHPFQRVVGILKDDILEFFGKLKYNSVVSIKKGENIYDRKVFPEHCDIVIIGGGIVGSSVAYHLQERVKKGLRIVIVEKDFSYSKASTVSSVGGIRQQFSLVENIILSKYGMDFLQHANSHLAIDEKDSPNINIKFNGYLTLATEEQLPKLTQTYETLKYLNLYVKFLTKDKIKEIFPWIQTDGIEAGIYGTQREGSIDPWSFLFALNRKITSLGVEFVNGVFTDGDYSVLGDYVQNEGDITSMRKINKINVTLRGGEQRTINAAAVVIAAGAASKEVGLNLSIGAEENGVFSIPIPVEPRKRSVYCFKAKDGPGLNCPLVVEPDGTYFRREGLADQYICSRPPIIEPSTDDLSVDQNHFHENILPTLSRRCSAFKHAEVQHSWAGYYDYNTFDQNPLIGRHPMFSNVFMATGFTGHGVQQALGAGKAITELLVDSELKTLDIEALGFERVIVNHPIVEDYVI